MSSNYSVLDQPEVLRCLFHPGRKENLRQPSNVRDDFFIPVESNVNLGASFHLANTSAPTIVFFHGNGEIVSDYDDFGQFYTQLGINLFVVDYRGYGDSTGSPTVTGMMKDCHIVLDNLLSYREKKNLTGPVCLMGRSLGSASAIELSAKRSEDISCLIIESGFAFAEPLLNLLGIDSQAIGYTEQAGFENVDKIKLFKKPCLIIHAQYDHIIAFSEGQTLFEMAGSSEKYFLEVKGANHNDIFFKGMTSYLDHVQKICFPKEE